MLTQLNKTALMTLAFTLYLAVIPASLYAQVRVERPGFVKVVVPAETGGVSTTLLIYSGTLVLSEPFAGCRPGSTNLGPCPDGIRRFEFKFDLSALHPDSPQIWASQAGLTVPAVPTALFMQGAANATAAITEAGRLPTLAAIDAAWVELERLQMTSSSEQPWKPMLHVLVAVRGEENRLVRIGYNVTATARVTGGLAGRN
jgi:hypothetical protein